MRKQTGFTLVEIAIVLVIIGLLLGGVLKGQELVINAQAKAVANDLKNVQTLIYGYQDRFRAIPGDDVQANTRSVGATNAAAGVNFGNGIINGNWNSITPTNESFLFWQHVRLAGFATGSGDTAAANYRPQNSQGGIIGVTGPQNLPITGMTGTYFACTNNINGKLARIVDTNLDDGISDTGSVRIRGNQAANNGGPVTQQARTPAQMQDATMYTVCMSF